MREGKRVREPRERKFIRNGISLHIFTDQRPDGARAEALKAEVATN
jgi:hypothetical protein